MKCTYTCSSWRAESTSSDSDTNIASNSLTSSSNVGLCVGEYCQHFNIIWYLMKQEKPKTRNIFSITGNEMNKTWKTKVMQNLGRGNKVYYGRCANGYILAISRSKTNMGYLRKGLFPLTLRLFAALYFCLPVFFSWFTSWTEVSIQSARGAYFFPLTPVHLALTLLDFLNVSSSFPWLWTSFLFNLFNPRMNDEARLDNTGMKPPQQCFRVVLFVLGHFT